MKVKFNKTVSIQGKFTVYKDEILNATDCGDNIIITLKNKRKTVSPKSVIGGIFDIVEEDK